MPRTYIVPLSEVGQGHLAVAGGKGSNLGELIQAGIPQVPSGFVVTTAAYDFFVAQLGLGPQVQQLVESNPAEKASNEIGQLFLQATVFPEMAAEIQTAYRELIDGSQQTRNNGKEETTKNISVAVRSSATAEDLPTASFAGQQDSFLNVQGEEALLMAIQQCWASLWTARAISYRKRQSISPSTMSMAVVVQVLVPAQSAGVLFTANPMTGERNEMVINAAWGLGEALVGGLVTPDSIVIHHKPDNDDCSESLEIVSRKIAKKTIMTIRAETGTAAQPVPTAKQDEAVLDDATALALANIGIQIQSHFGMPMDVEWAVDSQGKIAILQARAITSLPPEPLKNVVWEPVAPGTTWMRRQIVEHMPEPLSPLFEDLYARQGLYNAIEQIDAVMNRMIGTNFNSMSMLPNGFVATINGYGYTAASFKLSFSMFFMILKTYTNIHKYFDQPEFDWEGVVLPRYQSLIQKWKAIDVKTTADQELWKGIQELTDEDCQYWFGSAVYLGMSRLLDSTFNWLLHSFLIRNALPKSQPGSSSFLRGFSSKALDAQADMESLAATIRVSTKLRALVLEAPAEQVLEALAALTEGQPVLDAIQTYFDAYGHQIYNLDFAAPTQQDDPLPMLLSLKALVADAPTQDVRTRQENMANDRDTLVESTMAKLNPLTRKLFSWVWYWTKKFGPYREHVMFYVGAGWPTLRRFSSELGQRFVDAGILLEANDIYYLNSNEVAAAMDARSRHETLTEYIAFTKERRELRMRRKKLTPPSKVPERSVIAIGPIKLSMFDPTPTENSANSQGPVLDGYAVSSGVAKAPASVIHSPEDFHKMKPNTILVCRTTTPAWTPLFSQAAGLVTNVGGALAHGSIVAREYGIPAVMGTGVATERIQPGMMLMVDGDKGTVTLLDEANLMQAKTGVQTVGWSKRTISIGAVLGLLAGWMWRNNRL